MPRTGEPPDDVLADVRRFTNAATWTFAKTMPWAPHEYAVKGRDAGLTADFPRIVQLIREHGYERRHGQRVFTSLNADGWRYWSMRAPGRRDNDHQPGSARARRHQGGRP